MPNRSRERQRAVACEAPIATALLRSRLCLAHSYARMLSIARCFHGSPTSVSRTRLLLRTGAQWLQDDSMKVALKNVPDSEAAAAERRRLGELRKELDRFAAFLAAP